MNAMFFSTLGGLFPKMDKNKCPFFKNREKLLKKSLHSFSIRHPNIRGVTFMLLDRRTRGGHVQTIMLSLYKMMKIYKSSSKTEGQYFIKDEISFLVHLL